MEHIHIIGLNVNTIFDEKPVQSYLDTYLYIRNEGIGTEGFVSKSKVPEKAWGISWSK